MTIHTRTDAQRFLEYLERICRRSPHTVRSYSDSLRQYGDFLTRRSRCARSASFEDILDFAAHLHDKAPATARTRLAAVRALHRYLHATGAIDRDYAALVPSPKRQRGCRPAHDAQLVELVRGELESDRDRALFGLMYGSLLRISEARCALLEDVDLRARTITVVGKGDRLRTVELDQRTAHALGNWIRLDRHRPRSRYLFPSYKAGADAPMSEVPVRRMLARAVERAGASGHWTPHALRRSMGQHLRRVGADPFLVRDAFGHTHMSETAGYVAGDEAVRLPHELREAVHELARQTPRDREASDAARARARRRRV